jgi:ferredoxin--NADP+ reductase
MRIQDLDTTHRYDVTVRESFRITASDVSEVRHMTLQLPPNTPQFIEGQSLAVLVPGPHEFGNEYHMRLYSVASTRRGDDGNGDSISICVRRCFYLDEVSGERYPGIASNYLCDRRRGDVITIAGPYRGAFVLPCDPQCNLLMIGVGTGIAPFRAFVRRLYEEHGAWQGKVRLFYGARTGTELLYMNDERDDFSNYYDRDSFEAFRAISRRPEIDEMPPLDHAVRDHSDAIRLLLDDELTYVYVAGRDSLFERLDTVLAEIAGGADAWADKKAELIATSRWSELRF